MCYNSCYNSVRQVHERVTVRIYTTAVFSENHTSLHRARTAVMSRGTGCMCICDRQVQLWPMYNVACVPTVLWSLVCASMGVTTALSCYALSYHIRITCIYMLIPLRLTRVVGVGPKIRTNERTNEHVHVGISYRTLLLIILMRMIGTNVHIQPYRFARGGCKD